MYDVEKETESLKCYAFTMCSREYERNSKRKKLYKYIFSEAFGR